MTLQNTLWALAYKAHYTW